MGGISPSHRNERGLERIALLVFKSTDEQITPKRQFGRGRSRSVLFEGAEECRWPLW